MENQQTKSNSDRIATIGLCLGIASIFLWEFSIVPILAIILGVVSLVRGKTKWKSIVAIVLGIIFLLLRISQGHIDGGKDCTSFEYSDWSLCTAAGTQNRAVVKALPQNCSGGKPILTQACSFKSIPITTTNDLNSFQIVQNKYLKSPQFAYYKKYNNEEYIVSFIKNEMAADNNEIILLKYFAGDWINESVEQRTQNCFDNNEWVTIDNLPYLYSTCFHQGSSSGGEDFSLFSLNDKKIYYIEVNGGNYSDGVIIKNQVDIDKNLNDKNNLLIFLENKIASSTHLHETSKEDLNIESSQNAIKNCISFEYSDWSPCTINGIQGRTIVKSLPDGCSGGNPTQSRICNYVPILDSNSDILELTKPLLGKYVFLNDVINLSLPFFEDIYQKQQNSIARLQQLQSIKYNTDVANVLGHIQEESSKVLGVINGIKDERIKVKQGMEKLDKANITFETIPIDEYFRKFVNDETLSVDAWIYVFNPNNPDNLNVVVRERDLKTTELENALILYLKKTL